MYSVKAIISITMGLKRLLFFPMGGMGRHTLSVLAVVIN